MKKGKMMYKIRFVLSLLLVLPLFWACGDAKEASVVVNAYENAVEKVHKAANSEELLEISYALHLQLMDMTVTERTENARLKFETAVRDKEIEFYTQKHKKK